MNPFDTNNEQHLREQILNHEFPFEEQAWQDMEALLKRKKDGMLLAGLPQSDIAAAPRAVSQASKWILIAGLVLIVALFIRLTRNDAAPAPLQTPLTPLVPFEKAKPLKTSEKDAIVTAPILKNETGTAPENTSKVARTNLDTGKSALTVKEKGQHKSRKATKPVLFETPKNIESDIVAYPPLNPQNKPVEEKETPLSYTTNGIYDPQGNELSADGGLKTIPTLEPLSTLPQTPDNVSFTQTFEQGLPNIIRPVERPYKHRLNAGYLLGAQATAVDYINFKVVAGPHAGAFLRFGLSPHNAIQAELTAKWVNGYKLEASQNYANYNALGYLKTSAYNFDASRLGFVELPLIFMHQTAHSHFTWLAGVRPAFILPFGTTNYDGYAQFSPDLAGEQNKTSALALIEKADGLRKFDLGLIAGVEWQLGRNLFLDVRYTQGLYDLSYDNFFGNNAYLLNSDLQVSVRRFFRVHH